MNQYWRLMGNATMKAFSASASASRTLSSWILASQDRPSRNSRRRGILVPGDPPPSGARVGYLDYRQVLLPQHLTALEHGTFPLGRSKHPGNERRGLPLNLEWGDIRQHTAVVGPSGTGKTFGLLAPWTIAAQRAGACVIVVDTKGDFIDEIRNAKARMGIDEGIPYTTWDIDDVALSRPWSPLRDITSITDATQVATAILGEVDPADPQRFFAERDHRWMRGLLWLCVKALGSTAHPSYVYDAIVNLDTLRNLVTYAPHAAREIVDLINFDANEFARVTAGIANRISWMADPGLARILDAEAAGALSLNNILNTNRIVIVGARKSGGERSLIAASIFLNLCRIKCLTRFGTNNPPVLWILDEVAQYAHRIQVSEMLDILRGANSPVCLGLQDVNQLGSLEQQQKILSNCNVFISLRGVSAASARFLSGRLGSMSVPAISFSRGDDGVVRPTVTHHIQPLLGEREIMYPPIGEYGGVAHIRNASSHPFLFCLDE